MWSKIWWPGKFCPRNLFLIAVHAYTTISWRVVPPCFTQSQLRRCPYHRNIRQNCILTYLARVLLNFCVWTSLFYLYTDHLVTEWCQSAWCLSFTFSPAFSRISLKCKLFHKVNKHECTRTHTHAHTSWVSCMLVDFGNLDVIFSIPNVRMFSLDILSIGGSE